MIDVQLVVGWFWADPKVFDVRSHEKLRARTENNTPEMPISIRCLKRSFTV